MKKLVILSLVLFFRMPLWSMDAIAHFIIKQTPEEKNQEIIMHAVTEIMLGLPDEHDTHAEKVKKVDDLCMYAAHQLRGMAPEKSNAIAAAVKAEFSSSALSLTYKGKQILQEKLRATLAKNLASKPQTEAYNLTTCMLFWCQYCNKNHTAQQEIDLSAHLAHAHNRCGVCREQFASLCDVRMHEASHFTGSQHVRN